MRPRSLILSFLACAFTSCAPRPPATSGTTTSPPTRKFIALDRSKAWSFETPDLPAATVDGTLVAIGDGGDDRYAHVASLELVWMRVVSGDVARKITILAPDEYRKAFDDVAPETRATLAKVVDDRIVTARKDLAAESLAKIEPCSFVDVDLPTCKKRVRCAGLDGSYEDGTFHLGSMALTKPEWKTRPMDPKIVEGTLGEKASFDLVACPSDTFFDPTRRVFVARMTFRCAATAIGDWCSEPPAWFVVRA